MGILSTVAKAARSARSTAFSAAKPTIVKGIRSARAAGHYIKSNPGAAQIAGAGALGGFVAGRASVKKDKLNEPRRAY